MERPSRRRGEDSGEDDGTWSRDDSDFDGGYNINRQGDDDSIKSYTVEREISDITFGEERVNEIKEKVRRELSDNGQLSVDDDVVEDHVIDELSEIAINQTKTSIESNKIRNEIEHGPTVGHKADVTKSSFKHEWTYKDGEIDTYGTVMGSNKQDCIERVMMVLSNSVDSEVSREHLDLKFSE